jgi:hypothetical protein
MRFRLGLLIGGGAGYYLGAKAGHERYRQLNQMLEKARATEVYETAAEKAKAVVDLSVERAKDFVDEHKPGDDPGGADVTATTDTTRTPVAGMP